MKRRVSLAALAGILAVLGPFILASSSIATGQIVNWWFNLMLLIAPIHFVVGLFPIESAHQIAVLAAIANGAIYAAAAYVVLEFRLGWILVAGCFFSWILVLATQSWPSAA